VSTKTFATIKQAEVQARMASARRAKKSRKAALAEQKRVSIFEGFSKGRITNLPQVMRAMARWA
jgi:hypothetical protein